jgi:hypothetical protein
MLQIKNTSLKRAWWCTTVIPALGRLRQEDLEFKASLGYIQKQLVFETYKKNA